MKKILCICMVTALLIALTGCGAPAADQKESTLSGVQTEPATTPTESKKISVLANGRFTFTAADFTDLLGESLPAGYTFAGFPEANPDRHNKFQVAILNSDGEDTGIAILMNVKDPLESFSKIALTAGAQGDAETFSVLLDWFVSTFLSGLSAKENDAWQTECLDMFRNGEDGFSNVTTKEAVGMMILEEEVIGRQYYIVIAVNEP